MPSDRRRTTPSVASPAMVATLRRVLDGAGYTFDNIKRALNADDRLITAPHLVPMVSQSLGDGKLATLIRLFHINAQVSTEHASRALAPLSLDDAASLGMIAPARSRVQPAVRITPSDGAQFACDLEGSASADLPPDFVMGIAESTRMLARLTIRRAVERALDLGTGCGYHAVLASRHAEHVIATDVNPRALAFTAFNALLNGATNVECRKGDRFAPVEGLQFDLIVTNPPFVISPDRSYVYRDSGLGRDRLSQEVIQGVPAFLRPGGLAHILLSWIHTARGEWSAPLQEWVAGIGCDAWFLREGSYDPLAYAALWNSRLALASDLPRYTQAIDRWTRFYEKAGITALGYGAALLRKRDGVTRFRADDLPKDGVDASTAPEMDRLLAIEDLLESLSDEALALQTVVFDTEQRLEQVARWRDGGFRIQEATLIRECGLRPSASVDPPLAILFGEIDGKRPLDEVVARTGNILHTDDPGAQEVFHQEALPVIRQLLAHGFLRFVE